MVRGVSQPEIRISAAIETDGRFRPRSEFHSPLEKYISRGTRAEARDEARRLKGRAHADFVSRVKNGVVRIHVDKVEALRLVQTGLMGKHYAYVQRLLFWIWICGIATGFGAALLWAWWAGCAVLAANAVLPHTFRTVVARSVRARLLRDASFFDQARYAQTFRLCRPGIRYGGSQRPIAHLRRPRTGPRSSWRGSRIHGGTDEPDRADAGHTH